MVQRTPKRRRKALGLIQGGRHSLSEITKITSKQTLGDLKKRNTPQSKPRSGRPANFSERHKLQRIFHLPEITNLIVCQLIRSIIKDLQLQVHPHTLKQTLNSLGYKSDSPTSTFAQEA